MIAQIKDEISKTASFVWSLPPILRYPVIVFLAGFLPTIGVAIVVAGASVAVALSPVVLGVVIVWFAADRYDQ